MDATPGTMDGQRRDILAAGLVALAAHAALVLLAPRLELRPAPVHTRPLDVVFLLPPPPPARSRPAALTPDAPMAHPARARAPVLPAVAVVPTAPPAAGTTPTPEPPTARPLSAVYLQQARHWAAQQAAGPAPARDPLADRTPRVESDGRFRMQRAKSMAGTVAAIGRLFGGADYGPDDCRRRSGSIDGLIVAGDTRGAQEAIDYERRYCRP